MMAQQNNNASPQNSCFLNLKLCRFFSCRSKLVFPPIEMNWIYQLYCHQIFPWLKWIEYIKFIVIKSVSTQLWTQSPPQLCQLWTHTLTQLTNFYNTFMEVRTFLITHCECKGSPTKTKVHWFMPYWVEYILLGVYEKIKIWCLTEWMES